MNSNKPRGLLVPVLTPFNPDLAPAADAMIRHCHWLLEQGADGLAVFGTTSEANSLGCEERMDLLEALTQSGIAADKVMPGTGTCAITDTVRLTRHAVEQGCSGVLMLPPFYYKGVSDDGLYASFAEVIERTGDARLRIYLYHIPPMSSVPLSLDLVGRLVRDYPSVVVGLKDSGGNFEHTAALLREFPDLSIFPGSETFLLDGLRHGSSGCITATGNVNPAGIRNLIERWQEPEADQLQEQITAIRKVIQSYPMIPALKSIVAGHLKETDWLQLRPPLTSLDEASQARLIAELDDLGFSMAGNGTAAAA
jgi:4-hydroxy-tetrahydrodipicolinate synthase